MSMCINDYRPYRLGYCANTAAKYSGTAFTFQAFITGALLNAVPGIALQLMLIPAVMAALNRAKVVPFKHEIKQTAGSMAN